LDVCSHRVNQMTNSGTNESCGGDFWRRSGPCYGRWYKRIAVRVAYTWGTPVLCQQGTNFVRVAIRVLINESGHSIKYVCLRTVLFDQDFLCEQNSCSFSDASSDIFTRAFAITQWVAATGKWQSDFQKWQIFFYPQHRNGLWVKPNLLVDTYLPASGGCVAGMWIW
jgi:hypothetical protein